MKKINMNSYVKVKLTPLGAEIFYNQYDALNDTLKAKGIKPIEKHMPPIDKNGYTEMQLWCLMELYGEHISAAKPNVFLDVSIYVAENNLEEISE